MINDSRNLKNIGPYVLGKTIGKGTLAKVKKANHSLTNETVAIKIFKKNKLLTDEDFKLIDWEINILKKIKHKNIIQFMEKLETKDNIYIVMEYIQGEVLDLFNKKGKLSEIEACHFFQQIISILEYLHEQNIAHRDLNPANIIINNSSNNIKLFDFGLSKIYNDNSLLSTPCGTFNYVAPEIIKGLNYDGELTDIWSAGVILYALLIGNFPFIEFKDENILNISLSEEPYFPKEMSTSCSNLIKNLLEIDPIKRINLQTIIKHPWFNIINPVLYKGLKFGTKIPVDESVLELIQDLGLDKEVTRKKVMNNEFDQSTTTYYLIVKKLINEGKSSVSDMISDKYMNYMSNIETQSDNVSISGVSELSFEVEDKKDESNSKCWNKSKTNRENFKLPSLKKKSIVDLQINHKKLSILTLKSNYIENIEKRKPVYINKNRLSIILSRENEDNIELSYSDISTEIVKVENEFRRLSSLNENKDHLNKIYNKKPVNEKIAATNINFKNQFEVSKAADIVYTKNDEDYIKDKNLLNEERIKDTIMDILSTIPNNVLDVNLISSLKNSSLSQVLEVLNETKRNRIENKHNQNELEKEFKTYNEKDIGLNIVKPSKIDCEILPKGKTYLSKFKKEIQNRNLLNKTKSTKSEFVYKSNLTKSLKPSKINKKAYRTLHVKTQSIAENMNDEIIKEENESNLINSDLDLPKSKNTNFNILTSTIESVESINRSKKIRKKKLSNFSCIPKKIFERMNCSRMDEKKCLSLSKSRKYGIYSSQNSIDHPLSKEVISDLDLTPIKKIYECKKVLQKEKLRTYFGPIDLNCILLNQQPLSFMKNLLMILVSLNISYFEKNCYNLRCTRGTVRFNVEVMSVLDMGSLLYIKLNKIQGDFSKIVLELLNQIKKLIV